MFYVDQVSFPGIKPVTLRLDPGECIGLSGASGSGKSRLLRALADMDEHGGFASLDNESAASMPAQEWRRRVALVPAECQWWCDGVGEHFDDGVDFAALGFDEEVRSWDVARCSSGERQRLGILRSLANGPDVLLLDEPTANLDPDNTLRVETLIKQYLGQHDACCIWVSHNRLQLERVADRRYEFIDDKLSEVPGR